MIELEPDDIVNVAGRGLVATFRAGSLPDALWDPNQYLRREVIVRGKYYTVTGVERMGRSGTPEMPYKNAFGLLIKPIQTEDSMRSRLVNFSEWLSNRLEIDVFTPDELVDKYLKEES